MLSQPYILPNAPITDYVPPDDIKRCDLLVDYAMGGVELNNPAGGLLQAVWEASLQGHDLVYRRVPTPETVVVITTTGLVTELSASFDANMRPHLIWREDGILKFYWYNTRISNSEVTELPGITSPRLFLDDKRASASNTRDLLMFFLRDNKLYFRAQRQRFTIDNFMIDAPPAALALGRIGMGTGNRLQVEFIVAPDPNAEEW